MPSPIKPWRSYLLDSHGVSRVRPYPVRLDPRTLSQSLVRVPLIPYNAQSTPKSARVFNVSKSIGWLVYIVTSNKHQQKYPRSEESVFSPELRLALQARAPHAKQYAEFLLERITLEFQIACGSKGPWNFETFACLPDAIPNQSGLYILLLETPQTSDARFGPTGLDLYCGQAHGQQKNDPAWTGLPLRLKTYEQQSHSDTVKLQAKRECLGDRGKTERPCHPTIKYFVRYLKQFSMAAESSSRTKLANSSMTMISSGAQRHSIRPSGISLKLGCC
jgi:hypothetical protein